MHIERGPGARLSRMSHDGFSSLVSADGPPEMSLVFDHRQVTLPRREWLGDMALSSRTSRSQGGFNASGNISPDPANSRVFVVFTDAGGVVRGRTSVAVETE